MNKLLIIWKRVQEKRRKKEKSQKGDNDDGGGGGGGGGGERNNDSLVEEIEGFRGDSCDKHLLEEGGGSQKIEELIEVLDEDIANDEEAQAQLKHAPTAVMK